VLVLRASRSARALSRGIICVLLIAGFAGCVGVRLSRFEWTPAGTDVKTKPEVLERFGEPVRKAREGGREVWYYLVEDAPRALDPLPARERVTTVGVLISIWWVTRAKENLRFVFDGDDLIMTSALAEKGRGTVCGPLILLGAGGCTDD